MSSTANAVTAPSLAHDAEIVSQVAALPLLSVIVPVKNEAGNIAPLIDEIVAALEHLVAFEIIYVDDGSDDDSLQQLRKKSSDVPQLRILRHAASCGQSAAIRTAALAARGRWLVTLDGDGQNNPADIPAMLEKAKAAAPTIKMIAGQRVKRQDSAVRLWSSRLANGIRSRLLNDGVADTGCGLKLMDRKAFLQLPYFDHMHRYLPALMKRDGWGIELVPVSHRARERGTSKYGINNRLWVGIVDLLGVMWLLRRRRVPETLLDDIGQAN